MLFIDDEYICQNKALVALILFICIFYLINYIKPNFLSTIPYYDILEY